MISCRDSYCRNSPQKQGTLVEKFIYLQMSNTVCFKSTESEWWSGLSCWLNYQMENCTAPLICSLTFKNFKEYEKNLQLWPTAVCFLWVYIYCYFIWFCWHCLASGIYCMYKRICIWIITFPFTLCHLPFNCSISFSYKVEYESSSLVLKFWEKLECEIYDVYWYVNIMAISPLLHWTVHDSEAFVIQPVLQLLMVNIHSAMKCVSIFLPYHVMSFINHLEITSS